LKTLASRKWGTAGSAPRLLVFGFRTGLDFEDMIVRVARQVADWLEKLGMSEYAQRFAENGAAGAKPWAPIILHRTSQMANCLLSFFGAGAFCSFT
jgi:hypothetical protein